MKKFLIRILSFIGIPFLILLAVYLIIDPFKTLRPFSFQYFDDTNRDYLSSELFMKNDPIYHYNSFIFGSSRCGGFNTYHWKHYLPKEAKQFMFNAWGESLTGIVQKINYIDKYGSGIDNAIVLLDNPNSFTNVQLPKEVASIKHYKFSGQSKLVFQACLFYGFAQKPSKWIFFIKNFIKPMEFEFYFDTVSNDLVKSNQYVNIKIQPPKSGLSGCSATTKAVFMKKIENVSDDDIEESQSVITRESYEQLKHIKSIFDKHHTDYRIVISPTYCYTHPRINTEDLIILQEIFGEDRVFNYSGKNDITTDYNNYNDPEHFGLSVGWQIIEDLYNK